MTGFRQFLELAVTGVPLSSDQMVAAMDAILSGDASDVEIAGFLTALRTRGETPEEIAAAANAMRHRAISVDAPANAVDTAGTGGDGANTVNISTAAAIIAAGCGVPIAKHGNRALSSKSGSSDILEQLGVRLDIDAPTISRCINEANIGFMFAALHHKAVGHAANARKALGIRTMFNVLGPLSNPASTKRQLLGVFSPDLIRPIAAVLIELGVTHAWVVHGTDGLDELTITGETHVASVVNGTIEEFVVTPEDAGLERRDISTIIGGTPSENAAAMRAVLAGEKNAYRDVAVLNAAAVMMIAEKATTLKEGALLAQSAIDTGKAQAALDRLVEISNGNS